MLSSSKLNRKPSLFLWSSTLLLSVALHLGLFRLNPNLFLGGGAVQLPPSRALRHEMKIQAVSPERMRSELPRLLDTFDLQDPELRATESPVDLPDPAQNLFAEPELPPPEWIPEPARPAEEAPPMSASASAWQPRQEVMAVLEQKVSETLEILPRKTRDIQQDRPQAPDISLPGSEPAPEDWEPTVLGFEALGPEGDAAAPFRAGISAGLPAFTGAGISNLPPPELPGELTPELEPREEITGLEAVENLLRLEIRVFDDPEDARFRYFKLQLLPFGMDTFPVLPRDVVYLLDCSASMTDVKLRLAVEGIQQSLGALGETDRVNLIAFRDEVDLFAESGIPATVFGKAKLRTFLTGLQARGQTDVVASLSALQALPRSPQRPMLALLVTDGVPTQGLTDSSEIIEAFTRDNEGEISVFGLGGGGRVNRLLLDFLSYRNRGSSWVAPRAEGLKEVIPQSAREIRRPVLMNLQVQFTGAEAPEVFPQNLSHLYLDRPLILIGRTPRAQSRIAFQIVGTSAKGTHDILFPLDLDQAASGDRSLRQEWAWQALLAELSRSLNDPDPASGARVQELLDTFGLVIPDAYLP
ncbi:MAG: VWA domain-containing protein [Kiritimatiellia bacterium]